MKDCSRQLQTYIYETLTDVCISPYHHVRRVGASNFKKMSPIKTTQQVSLFTGISMLP